MTRLLVAGSIALDTIDMEAETVTEELGGSALYFALAASLITPVALVAPVGVDAESRVRAVLAGRPVDLEGLTVLEQPTYRWRARHVTGGNRDLGSADSIYDHWTASGPQDFSGWAFAGSMRIGHQVDFLRGLPGARLRAADAMLSYTREAPARSAELLRLCDWFFCNAAELGALGWKAPGAARFRAATGLAGLCLKSGPGGATVIHAAGDAHVPALPSRPVRDTTGAGDALAGGFLARWLTLEADPEGIPDALVHGTACASLVIEEVGLRGLQAATRASLDQRVEEVRGWLGSGGWARPW